MLSVSEAGITITSSQLAPDTATVSSSTKKVCVDGRESHGGTDSVKQWNLAPLVPGTRSYLKQSPMSGSRLARNKHPLILLILCKY